MKFNGDAKLLKELMKVRGKLQLLQDCCRSLRRGERASHDHTADVSMGTNSGTGSTPDTKYFKCGEALGEVSKVTEVVVVCEF